MKTVKPTIWAFFVVFISLFGYNQNLCAQSIEVKGKIFDNEGNELPGAFVMKKTGKEGVMTANDGSYSITASIHDTLLISLIGYVTQEEVVMSESELNIILREDKNVLQESVIVDVGYGGQSRKDLTGTVSFVKPNDILKSPVINFDQALQGRMAGVQVASSDGQPGSEMEIVIRGANSLTQSNAPLYVVDGFPMDDFASSSINTNDIASIAVLKDASATAIYGARGANGVVVIETKKGREGTPKVEYNGTFGFQKVRKTMELMNAAEYVEYQIERSPSDKHLYLDDLGLTMEDYRNMGKGIDCQDELFRIAPIQKHNVSVYGGTKKSTYSLSLSAADQKGVIINSGYQKYQGRISMTQRLRDNIKLSANVSYTYDNTYGQTSSSAMADNNAYASYLMYRAWGYKPISINSYNEGELFDDEFDGAMSPNIIMNPVISSENEDTRRVNNIFVSNAKLEWEFINGLKLTVLGGYSMKSLQTTVFNNSKTYQGFPSATNPKGVNGREAHNVNNSWVNENTLNYVWKNKKHKVDALVGFTLQGANQKNFGYSTKFIPYENLGISGIDDGSPDTMTASLSDNALMSCLARLNYNYSDRYLFTASFRMDASSKFSRKNRWGIFPSGAFAWRVSKEKFMKNVRFINDMKLRVSYGLTGNNRIPDYARYSSMELSDHYSFGNAQPETAYVPKILGNDDLKWETTAQIDFGLDLLMFDNRVNIIFDIYQKNTRDLLLKTNVPYSSGYPYIYKNIGKVQNRGLEFTLSTVNVRTRNFEWTSDFNISFNRSELQQLSDGEQSYLSTVSFTGDFNSQYLYMAKIGEPIAQFYGIQWDGVYGYDDFDIGPDNSYVLKKGVPTNGAERASIKPGDIKYVDQNNDGIINYQDMVVIGRCEPRHFGGFNNTFTYKGLSLSIFFQWRTGVDIMNANRMIFEGNYANTMINQFKSYVDRWTPENQDSRNFRAGGAGPKGIYSSRTIEDGSFLRLKTLQLSYSFPKRLLSKIKIDNLQIYLSGENLWTWTKYSGLDPEVSTRNTALTPGFDYSAYARNTIFTMGVKLVL